MRKGDQWVNVCEVVVDQNLDCVQVAYRLGRQLRRRRQSSQTIGGIVGGRASGRIKAAAALELLSLDGFGMSVRRTSTTTGTVEGARDLKSRT